MGMYGNPINASDPTGHFACWDDNAGDPGCSQNNPVTKSTPLPSKQYPGDPDEISIDLATGTVLFLDGVSAIVSGVEAGFSDVAGVAIMAIGCGGAGPGTYGLSCGISAQLAYEVDVYVASPGSVIGGIEHSLGYASLLLTWWSDQDNTWSFDENGNLTSINVGKDTAIAARNTLLGQWPESNVDAAISFSQFKYDLDRLYGVKSGGPIEIYNASSGLPGILGNIRILLNQVIWKDWW